MSINTSFYLQTSNSLVLILRIFTVILSLEGKDNASHRRAELRSHMCVYTSVLNCLILRRDTVPFLQLPFSLKTVTELWQTWNLCFTENLSNLLSIWIANWIGHTELFFSCNLYFKNILKDGNEIYKRLTATGKSGMTLFYHTLPVSLYFILLFSLYIITFFTIWICTILPIYFAIACDVQRKILFWVFKVLIV